MSAEPRVRSQSHTHEDRLDRILSAISLFLPQVKVSTFSSLCDTMIAIERSDELSQRPFDLTMARVVKGLAKGTLPRLMLVTSDESDTSASAIIGAYFPGPLWVKNNETVGKQEVETGTSHLLFELQPHFRLMRWNGPQIPLADLFHTDDDMISIEDVEAIDDSSPTSSKSYRIGSAGRQDASLRTKPEAGSATLSSFFPNPEKSDGDDIAWYKNVGKTVNAQEEVGDEKWEVTVTHARIDIFTVSGGVDDTSIKDMMKKRHDPRYTQDPTEPRITGEALTKRIYGFGSD